MLHLPDFGGNVPMINILAFSGINGSQGWLSSCGFVAFIFYQRISAEKRLHEEGCARGQQMQRYEIRPTGARFFQAVAEVAERGYLCKAQV